MSNEKKLKPCPFCGCEYIQIGKVSCKNMYNQVVDGYVVQCLNCNIETGPYADKATPIWLWNQRKNLVWQKILKLLGLHKPDKTTLLMKRNER